MILNSKGEEIFAKYPLHPGEILADELEARHWSLSELVARVGIDRTVIEELIEGKESISAEMALKLESVLGTSAAYWLNAQSYYNRHVAYLKARRSDL